jgi:hypothetical protein
VLQLLWTGSLNSQTTLIGARATLDGLWRFGVDRPGRTDRRSEARKFRESVRTCLKVGSTLFERRHSLIGVSPFSVRHEEL